MSCLISGDSEPATRLRPSQFCPEECSEDMWPVENGFNISFGDRGVKEKEIICAHVHLSHRLIGPVAGLLKGRGRGENPHDTVSLVGRLTS